MKWAKTRRSLEEARSVRDRPLMAAAWQVTAARTARLMPRKKFGMDTMAMMVFC